MGHGTPLPGIGAILIGEAVYEAYKGNRDATPAPFKGQVAVIERVLETMHIPSLSKPQFEAERSEVAKGVVRDPEVQRNVVRKVIEAARAWDAGAVGVVDSGLPGPKGNREFFVHLRHGHDHSNPDESERWIADAVG